MEQLHPIKVDQFVWRKTSLNFSKTHDNFPEKRTQQKVFIFDSLQLKKNLNLKEAKKKFLPRVYSWSDLVWWQKKRKNISFPFITLKEEIHFM